MKISFTSTTGEKSNQKFVAFSAILLHPPSFPSPFDCCSANNASQLPLTIIEIAEMMTRAFLLFLTSFLYVGFAVNDIDISTASIRDIVLTSYNDTVPRNLRAGKDEPKSDGALPSVFIVGAQKGGSMSLLDLLTQHPLLCGHREPHFFSIDENYAQGSKYYKNLFRDGKCNKNPKTAKYIDGTPMLHMKKVWDRIVETYDGKDGRKLKDNLKFIVLLREPVSRDFVWYQHIVRNDLYRGQKFAEIMTLQEMNQESNFTARNGEDTRYGRYIDHVQEFLKRFRRDQLLILSSQAIFDDASSVMKKVYKFLEVPEDKVVSQILPRVNHFLETGLAFETCAIHHIPEMDCEYRDQMGEYYEPYNKELYSWIKATKSQANVNEPPFDPLFEPYSSISCVKNARKTYDDFLSKEKDTILLRKEFQTKTNGFNLPEGACHLPKPSQIDK
jgi:hypothetical protein